LIWCGAADASALTHLTVVNAAIDDATPKAMRKMTIARLAPVMRDSVHCEEPGVFRRPANLALRPAHSMPRPSANSAGRPADYQHCQRAAGSSRRFRGKCRIASCGARSEVRTENNRALRDLHNFCSAGKPGNKRVIRRNLARRPEPFGRHVVAAPELTLGSNFNSSFSRLICSKGEASIRRPLPTPRGACA
jgi:hypothetical protein